ncbi:hypothetical protein J8L73_03475 [Pseudoalteromonas sp. MMG006]|uniref:hypothetical protein n=1 Tax=Pseudoalteromonas sp. MMG006 TaxID=2822683 RepID=UPI001B382372|nr:hypothetical protein [Pseudoalteromonas sp. MMG006]MBQ4798208.1 hypothetical protein [Pseudoalteromonas sp. MMG006]
MQTNTKAKQQPKSISWVLTPEIMVLSFLLVAALVVTITILRDSSSLEPLVDVNSTSFLQSDIDNTQLVSETFDAKNINYAQHLDTPKRDENVTFSN